MNHWRRLLDPSDPSDLAGLTNAPGLPAFHPALLAQHRPDAHWVQFGSDGTVVGRFSLWWPTSPAPTGERRGILGHYAVVADPQAAAAQLAHACQELKAHGCTHAVGPMDGNTWRNYRLVTESRGDPPFFLEPTNPPEWPQHFTAAGFRPLANYYSAVDEQLAEEDVDTSRRMTDRLTRLGITLRPLDLARFENELPALHSLITASFRNGFLYEPISETEFIAQYQPLRAYVRPELVTIAMLEDRPVGLIFTVPDLLEEKSGRPRATVIVKTLAIRPERRLAGLGGYLLAANRRAARASGYRRSIHALMHEANKSRSLSARSAVNFRRYTLFTKPL